MGLKRLVPKKIISAFHRTEALTSAVAFGFPSRKLIVVGVTGTKGKTTTVNLIGHLLNASGIKTGVVSTVQYRIGNRVWPNLTKMTMPGRAKLSKLIAQMVADGCEVVVVETSSEGLAQWRHSGIAYDVAVFLNLSPEHLEAHGSLEAYRRAKERLFTGLKDSPTKTFRGAPFPKTAIVNSADPAASHFLSIPAERRGSFDGSAASVGSESWPITDVRADDRGIRFRLGTLAVESPLLGRMNLGNIVAALLVGHSFGIPIDKLVKHFANLPQLPGRMEIVDVGKPVTVLVDYAHEPLSLTAVLTTGRELARGKRVIAVFGATGGGRDTWKRPVMGQIAARLADITVVTTDDPYQEDPQRIVDAVAAGARGAGARDSETLLKVLDRRAAIRTAFERARTGDVIAILGKGREPMVVGKRMIPWDDREIARTESAAFNNNV
jgi:UDP-N-acetylmuramoyl-L-alanyl-D-glutamate--2,6-diaminopimelate ligase